MDLPHGHADPRKAQEPAGKAGDVPLQPNLPLLVRTHDVKVLLDALAQAPQHLRVRELRRVERVRRPRRQVEQQLPPPFLGGS